MAPTPKDVAEWMVARVYARRRFYQVYAARAIARRFGSEFVYLDDQSNLAIDRRVLYHFRKLTAKDVVWVTIPGYAFVEKAHWRKRRRGDGPERTQYLED